MTDETKKVTTLTGRLNERTTITLRREEIAKLVTIMRMYGLETKRKAILYIIDVMEKQFSPPEVQRYEKTLLLALEDLVGTYTLTDEGKKELDELHKKYGEFSMDKRKELLELFRNRKAKIEEVELLCSADTVDDEFILDELDKMAVDEASRIQKHEVEKKKKPPAVDKKVSIDMDTAEPMTAEDIDKLPF